MNIEDPEEEFDRIKELARDDAFLLMPDVDRAPDLDSGADA